MKALARLVGAVPGHDHSIELQNLLLDAEQLIAERGKTRTGNLWHPFSTRVGHNMQQFRDTFAPDRRDNAELGKVRSDRINHRGLLADETWLSHRAASRPHVGAIIWRLAQLRSARSRHGGLLHRT
jgi:hypothetical protein